MGQGVRKGRGDLAETSRGPEQRKTLPIAVGHQAQQVTGQAWGWGAA